MENMRILIDRLEQAARARRAASGTTSTNATPAAPVPGLRFQTGERVIDLATGSRGTVLDGVRDEGTGRQAYSLELRNGETVYRTVSEIERDATLTPRGGR